MQKYLLLVMLLCLILVPTNVHAASSILTFAPTGTVTTPYPTITALVHTFNAFVLLDKTTMVFLGKNVSYTSSLANIIPGDTSWTSDITLSYAVQKWLVEGNYTVVVNVKIFDMATHANTTLTKQWWFVVSYDVTTKMMFGLNSTVILMNSTLAGIRHDYTTLMTRIDDWIPTLQTMNNTMRYWNSTIENSYNLIATTQAMFQSPNGSIYVLLSNAKDYIFYGLFGLGILLLIGLIALALIVRRTRGSYESQPPMTRAVGPPSYPMPPRLQPQVSVKQPTGTMAQPAGGPIICPSCGQSNRPVAVFCANCKNKLVPEEAQPS